MDRSRLEDFHFRHRGRLTALAALAPPLLGAPRAGMGPWAWGAGVALVAGAAALRLWARRHIGRSSDTRRRRISGLVCGGPYARVRNPLYLANLLAVAGACVLCGYATVAPLAALVGVAEYSLVSRGEERLLVSTIPEGRDYLRRVPRWLPRPGARWPRPSTPRWAWSEALRREAPRLLGLGAALALAAALLEIASRRG